MDGKTILVPLDGSRASEAALPYATAAASAKGGGLRLLTVVDTSFEHPFLREEIDTEVTQRRQDVVQAYLHGKAAVLRTQGHDVSSTLAHGDPAEAVLQAADAPDVEMVVLATHGRGGLQRWVLGSVADKVMRMAQRPTLLLRPPDVLEPARPVTFRRLLLPLDGSVLAEEAVPHAARLAEETGAGLLLVRVEQWLSASIAYWGEGAYVPNLALMEQEAAAAAAAYLAEVKRRLPASVRSEALVLRGSPVPTLETLLDQRQVDLVVMSTHGRSGLPRLVLGSAADRLVRDGFPTLLVRPPADEPGDSE